MAGRPRKNPDAVPTRDRLLEAASETMIRAGSPDVSLQEVAAVAGMTAPLLTYYFTDKAGLLLALALRDTRLPLAQIQEMPDADMAAEVKLKIHIRGLLRLFMRLPYLDGLVGLLLADPRTQAEIRAAFMTPLEAARNAILAAGVRDGVFRDVDPDFFFMVVSATAQRLVTTHSRGVDKAWADSQANAILDLMLAGLSVKPAPQP